MSETVGRWTIDASGKLVAVRGARNSTGSPGEHGTANMYFTKKCRCKPCRKAATEYSKMVRYQRYATPYEKIPHGTKNGYCNYGCRCKPCLKAVQAYKKKYTQSPESKKRQNEKRNERRRLQREALRGAN